LGTPFNHFKQEYQKGINVYDERMIRNHIYF
jgi:hypothetical protein